ncbi:GNAT family N-acetyltransferase [Paenibacillus sepulcri]|uniref:GNAT family N-acetyltransferase n=1 Tax=Paenibacillus sepulcri TaxID=359917 RepID=UPI0035EDF8C7
MKIIDFASRFGGNRLSAAGLSELRRLPAESLAGLEHEHRLPLSATVPAALKLDYSDSDGMVYTAGSSMGPSAPAEALSATAAHLRADVPPAAVAIALEGGKLAAIAFAADAGKRACLVVVHPGHRGRRIGSALLSELRGHFGGLMCSVAADNPASMQMCFHAGMKAVELFTGPTGKPTLRFEC